MSTTKSTDVIATMGEWFDKVPPLPKNWRDTLARIAPILALIFGVLDIIFTVLGIISFTVLSPFAYMGGVQYPGYGLGVIAEIIFLVGAILLLASYPGLKAKKYKGWTFLFWSEVANFIGSLVLTHFFSAIVGAIIGFYLIFQIRSYFK